MLYIRDVKTKIGSISVQVVRYLNRKRIVVKHIGTGNNQAEIIALKAIAHAYIEETSLQSSLFEEEAPCDNTLTLNQCKYLGFYYTFLYDVLQSLQTQIGYTHKVDGMLND
jgi:hypothetical protein